MRQFATGLDNSNSYARSFIAQRAGDGTSITSTPQQPTAAATASEAAASIRSAAAALNAAERDVAAARDKLDALIVANIKVLGATAIAEAWGVTRQAVYNAVARHDKQ